MLPEHAREIEKERIRDSLKNSKVDRIKLLPDSLEVFEAGLRDYDKRKSFHVVPVSKKDNEFRPLVKVMNCQKIS